MTTTTARKLFGTDGIRGIAGEPPLDVNTIYATGLALGHSLSKTTAEPAVILGRDTRESSPWIAATVAAGLREAGARVESAGIVPTPAVAFLARTHGFQAGVVISASHNPWRDNGIKLFGGDGFKLPDARRAGDRGRDPPPRRRANGCPTRRLFRSSTTTPISKRITSGFCSTAFRGFRSTACALWQTAPTEPPRPSRRSFSASSPVM